MHLKYYFIFAFTFIGELVWSAGGANNTMNCKIEMSGTLSNGQFAPVWLSANRYGMPGNNNKNGYLSAGIEYSSQMKKGWRTQTGIELSCGLNTASQAWIQQAYWDIGWNCINLSIGSKHRFGWPLEKNPDLTSGWMVEGMNNRPIPQVRAEIKDYWNIPGTKNWLAIKGHVAYGYFTDGKWQENFVKPGTDFTRDVLYHSKALMFRIGNRLRVPVEFEFGLIMAAQFGGDRMRKNEDGSVDLISDFPSGFKDYLNILIPKRENRLDNVQGNHCGSWNFGLNLYIGDWKIRGYLEHYFEDHSQMFWEYGRWKDGHIGVELVFPKNRWIETVVWEGLNTTDQTGPILYDDAFSFKDIQMSGGDDYYTNIQYLGWQNYGAILGHPLVFGPEYNNEKSNIIKSSRMKAQHLGIKGHPADEWSWKFLASFLRHRGTYAIPFDEIKHQFSSMLEINYAPRKLKNFDFSMDLALDRGEYPGNSCGAMVTVRYKWFK